MSPRWYLPFIILALWATGCRMEAILSPPPPLSTPASLAAGSQKYPVHPLTLQSNLEQLERYQTHLTLEFEGRRGGEATQGQLKLQTALDRPATISHYAVAAEGILPEDRGRAEFLRVGDKVYLKRDQEQFWFELQPQTSPGALGLWEPERWVVLPATVTTPPQFETLNGLEVQHYRFTQADLAVPNLLFQQAEGEVWVATHGRYIVRYAITATARLVTPLPNATFFDDGRFNLSYRLTELNTDLALIPPQPGETIPPPLMALPRLPDATVTTLFPALLEYTSAISPVSATLFYQAELLNQGWTEEKIEVFNEKASLSFSRDDQALQVIIFPDQVPARIKVMMDLQSSQPR